MDGVSLGVVRLGAGIEGVAGEGPVVRKRKEFFLI